MKIPEKIREKSQLVIRKLVRNQKAKKKILWTFKNFTFLEKKRQIF